MSGRASPGTRDAYRAFKRVPTRWGDNDAYGHVNNVLYYAYFDTAVNIHLIESGFLDIAASPVIGLVVETQCRYYRPIAYPDVLQIGLRVAHRGRSSVRYELAVFRGDEDEASAEGHFIHVYVDRATNKPVPLPDTLQRALDPLCV